MMPKDFTIVNFGHAVSKFWLRPCTQGTCVVYRSESFNTNKHLFSENKAIGVMKPGHTFTIEPMISEGECLMVLHLYF